MQTVRGHKYYNKEQIREKPRIFIQTTSRRNIFRRLSNNILLNIESDYLQDAKQMPINGNLVSDYFLSREKNDKELDLCPKIGTILSQEIHQITVFKYSRNKKE